MEIIRHTSMGEIKGLDCDTYEKYLGVRYATAERFCYATPVNAWEGVYDATKHGPACPQMRTYYQHLEHPERRFYYEEFRVNQEFFYDEDCLNLNIFTPKEADGAPVLLFIHGGGFDSGANYDSAIAGDVYAKRGIVCVSIHYRVGVFGYAGFSEVYEKYGREGNYGLDDQKKAITWVRDHIKEFGGDPDNITLMGQSAGAMSIQYMCVSKAFEGLFQRVIMMSGAGLFPKFSLPKPMRGIEAYWLDVMGECGAAGYEEFAAMDPKQIFTGIDAVKLRRKDNTYNTMPVVDGILLTDSVDVLIKTPLAVDTMVGFTNHDMYCALLARISIQYARQVNGYLYYFDVDAPGDDHKGAFHSADIRYMFGTLGDSHRPYDATDEAISEMMISQVVNFAKTGDPNGEGLPQWERAGKALHITRDARKSSMGGPNWFTLIKNTVS